MCNHNSYIRVELPAVDLEWAVHGEWCKQRDELGLVHVPMSPIVYTSSHKVLNLHVIQMLMCTSRPCSLQSLSLDLLNKMSTSLAQNKTMVKLTIRGYDLSQVQDGKLFIRHLLLGLSGNNTLTDLTLAFPSPFWDWPEG